MSSAISNQLEPPPPADAIDDAIGNLIVAERELRELLAGARDSLVAVEEENRRLRREALASDVRWYTEQQLAARIGISKDTLARLRRKRKVPCVKFTPTVIRYSSLQEAQIAEMLEQGTSGQLKVLRRKAG